MTRALLELQGRTIKGRLRRSIQLLRQPKYLIGTLLGFCFMVIFYFFFLIPSLSEPDQDLEKIKAMLPFLNSSAGTELLSIFASLAALVGLSVLWIFLPGRRNINLNITEYETLLPAPVSRRALVGYSLWKGQAHILLGAVSTTLVLSLLLARIYWIMVPLYWSYFTLITLHIQLIMALKARCRQFSASVLWTVRLIVILGLVIYWYFLSVSLVQIWTTSEQVFKAMDLDWSVRITSRLDYFLSLVQELQVTKMLAPGLILILPVFKSDTVGGLSSWFILWGLIFLQYRGVVSLRVREGHFTIKQPYQESQSEHEIGLYMKSFLHGSAQSRPFNLPAIGKPEMALFWKTFLLVYRTKIRTLLLYAGAVFLVLLLVTTALGTPKIMISLEWVLGLIITINIIFLNVGNDLHYDLKRLELVKTWPVPGYRYLTAKTLAVAVLTTLHACVGLGLMLTAYYSVKFQVLISGAFSGYHFTEVGFQDYFSSRGFLSPLFHVLAFVPLITSVSLLYCSLQNLSILLFPGWVAFSEENQGLAMTGLSILIAVMLILLLLLGLVPGGLIIAVIVFFHQMLSSPIPLWEYLIFGFILVLAILGEVALLLRFSGRLWDRLDLSLEIR